MQPTRQEMLSAIEHKIARIEKGEWTGHNDCLTCGEQNIFTTHTCIVRKPVTIGDVLYYMDRNCNWIDDGQGNKSRDLPRFKEAIVAVHYLFIRGQHLPLHSQDDDCISYIFNLISHV